MTDADTAAGAAAVVGVCSWSLRPTSPSDLARKVRQTGLAAIQLALGPLRAGAWSVGRTADRLAEAGIVVRSGMLSMRGEDYSTPASIRRTGGLVPDATWRDNREAAAQGARLASRLGVRLVSFHAGCVPEERGAARRALLERLGEVVDVFADEGVAVALETGPDRAGTLLEVLAELDRPTLGVNLDPANVLLFDTGDPVAALERLAPHVRQVHVKDARRPAVPGTWGTEVAVGTGEVDWPRFLAVLRRAGLEVDLMIEREAGDDRVGDVRAAARLVREPLGGVPRAPRSGGAP